MPAFRDFPIKIKLTLMILSASFVALSITSAIFIVRDRTSFRDQMTRDMSIRAEILAANAASAVSFDDKDAAKQILEALKADEHVLAAAILKPDGTPFASYGTAGAAMIAASSVLSGNSSGFVDQYLDVTHQIVEGGKTIGILFIRTDLSAMNARINWYIGMALLVGLIVIGLTWLLAAFFQRYITRPISGLAKAADQIALGNINQKLDYSSKDEIGNLHDSFRSLIVYMRDLANAAELVANNDLTVTITPKSQSDVLSMSFKTMVANLAQMVGNLRDSAGMIVSAASEIAASSEHMSRGAGDQARQIGEVSNAIEEISVTIMESVNNAGEASQQSRTASKTASTGGELVSETINGMQKLTEIVRNSAVTISKLAKSSEQIGQIVSTINDIADQTNLLALNAAIEAARAGESGRGFAVVADEVRKLAERTGKATGEISQMVKSIQHDTVEAVDNMKSGVQQADIGRELADKAQRSLTEIVTSTQQVLGMIEQIAKVSQVQSDSAEEISRNIEHISTVTRETAAGAQQSSQAATELNQQAATLQHMVERFKLS